MNNIHIGFISHIQMCSSFQTFLHFLMLWHWGGRDDPGEIALPGLVTWQVEQAASRWARLWSTNQPVQSHFSEPPPLPLAFTLQGQYFLALITSGPGAGQPETTHSPESTRLFNLSIVSLLKRAYHTSPVPSHENPYSGLMPSASRWPECLPMWPRWLAVSSLSRDWWV